MRVLNVISENITRGVLVCPVNDIGRLAARLTQRGLAQLGPGSHIYLTPVLTLYLFLYYYQSLNFGSAQLHT
jgi:hypothetical protein